MVVCKRHWRSEQCRLFDFKRRHHSGCSSRLNIWRRNYKTKYIIGNCVVEVCEAIVPKMMQRKMGSFVIVSSIAAFTPMPKSALYAAAKSYVTSYGRSLNLEVRKSGVRVCVVCPGYVRTELHQQAGLTHFASGCRNGSGLNQMML